MKKLFSKISGIFVVIIIIIAFVLKPVKAQSNDFKGWQTYSAYTSINSAIHFESWIFTIESIREAFGLSYIIGYMNGVNNDDWYTYFYKDKIKSEKWYQKGRYDGFLDRFLYQSRQCMSLQVLTANYFGFLDYMTPYLTIRKWLKALSVPQYFSPNFACSRAMPSLFYASVYHNNRDFVYVSNSPEKPNRSPNDYRNKEEHKNIPLSRLREVPEYKPTDQPTRSENDDRDIKEHTTVRPTSLTRDIDLRPILNEETRNDDRKNNSVLRRAYQDWPELRRYVKRNGFSNIHVVQAIRGSQFILNMEKATIEIAIPGRQFDYNFSRRLVNSLNINLPEFKNRIRTRARSKIYLGGSRVRQTSSRSPSNRVNTRRTVRTSTRDGSRTRSRQSSTGNRSGSERVESSSRSRSHNDRVE